MTTFNAFLPVDRRTALAGGYELQDRTTGAALFADISGFTPLTAALAVELGPRRGAEELNNQINRVFNAVITQVHTYRGSVINFSGDAITCWFDGDDGRRTTTAALAMQEAIQALGPAHTPGGMEISIGLKVAVAAGPARRFLVGDPNSRHIEVLAGRILDRTAVAEKLAAPGEVVLSREVRESLGDDLATHEERWELESENYYLVDHLANPSKPNPWPEIPPVPTDVANHWILPAITQRLEIGKGLFLSDLRLATAVFLKFSGIDYDGDDLAGEKLDTFVRWVQSTLDRYGGVLEHVTLGDKGSYLLIIFGAPIAHEDDSERAMTASLELQNMPPQLAYISGIQIGINSGRVYAGTYGGSDRFTYSIQGEAANIAARMMSHAAPGKIMTSAKLAAVSGKNFQFQALESIQMKGIKDPLPVVYLEGRRVDTPQANGLPAAAGRMIGRVDERAEVDAALLELAGGQSSILIIEGQAGIGKSSLVADLQSEAYHLGLQTFEGSGHAVEQSSPYFAWRLIFQAIFDLDLSADHAQKQVLAQLEEIDPAFVDLAPLMKAILPLDFPENELTAEMTGEDRANNLNRMLTAVLISRAAAIPMLLILEDAHWLDTASWRLARVVARDVSPLLLVIATRPPVDPSPDFIQFKQSPKSRTLSLELLDPDTILAIVRRRLGVNELPQAVASLILEKAEGHPFFSEELAFALRDAGHIQIADGRVGMVTSAAELQSLTFPDTIQGVITSRIDGVSAKQQLTLKVASVIGRIFAYKILHDIDPAESNDDALQSDLAALEKLEITPLETPEPELAYIFRHIITQEVVYELLTFTQRKRLHQATAEWYETKQAGDLSSVYALLAHHWTIAEVTAKSIPYSLMAGRQALQNGAFQEAIKHLSDGLERNEKAQVISDPVELAEWNYQLGTAYRQTGQLDSSLSRLMGALELLGRPVPTGSVRLPASLMSQLGRQILHRLSPGFFDGRAKAEDHPLLVAKIYEGLQHIFFYQDKTVATVYSILRHLNLGEEAPPSAQRVRSYSAMVNVAGVTGLHKQAQGYIRLTEQALNMDVSLSDRGLVLQYLAIYYGGAGRWTENETSCQGAIEIAEKIGNRRRWQENVSCLALALYSQGAIERSTDLRHQVLDAASKDDDRQIQIWGWLELAEISLLQGKLQEATDFLARAQNIEGGRDSTEEIWLFGLLGVTHLRSGAVEAAKTAVDQAQAAIARSAPGAFYLLEALSGMAELNMALWQNAPESGELKKRMKGTLAMLKQFARSFPFSKPRSLLWSGMFALHSGNGGKATKIWLEGLTSARELKMPCDEALILAQLGTHAQGESSLNKEEYLSLAQNIFEKLGAAQM